MGFLASWPPIAFLPYKEIIIQDIRGQGVAEE